MTEPTRGAPPPFSNKTCRRRVDADTPRVSRARVRSCRNTDFHFFFLPFFFFYFYTTTTQGGHNGARTRMNQREEKRRKHRGDAKVEEEMDGGKSYRARTIAIPTKFSALSCYGIVKLNDALNYK